MTIPLFHVDAFTDRPFAGNPAAVCLLPSWKEGLPLSVLEAMACGRAVACSNTSAMPEVADGAAILFDPRSTAEMTRAMADLLRDAELRARMERLGQQRVTQFSWQQSAQKTLEVYYDVAERNRQKNPQRVTASISTR